MYRKYKKREYYTLRAQREGYPARSVYKLKEIDERFGVFKNGDKVLDLGCAPGSWLIYISRKVGPAGKVVGVDLGELSIKPEANTVFIHKDVRDYETFGFEKGEKFNVIVSDLAPSTSGVKSLDAGRSLELCEIALEIARKFLANNGNFVCKIFEGEGIVDFMKQIKINFKILKRLRPKAVVKGSREFYIIGQNFVS